MLSNFPTSFFDFRDSTFLLSQTTNDLFESARSKASSLFEPLSRYSSNSSETSSLSTTSYSSSANSTSTASSTTPLPLINILVLSDTPPLRSSSQRKPKAPRPQAQRRDTPMYISPREKGVKRVELKSGGWVGIVEE